MGRLFTLHLTYSVSVSVDSNQPSEKDAVMDPSLGVLDCARASTKDPSPPSWLSGAVCY